jgi:hypothetical protein
MALFGGFAKPLRGLRLVLGHSQSFVIKDTELILRLCIALFASHAGEFAMQSIEFLAQSLYSAAFGAQLIEVVWRIGGGHGIEIQVNPTSAIRARNQLFSRVFAAQLLDDQHVIFQKCV